MYYTCLQVALVRCCVGVDSFLHVVVVCILLLVLQNVANAASHFVFCIYFIFYYNSFTRVDGFPFFSVATKADALCKMPSDLCFFVFTYESTLKRLTRTLLYRKYMRHSLDGRIVKVRWNTLCIHWPFIRQTLCIRWAIAMTKFQMGWT